MSFLETAAEKARNGNESGWFIPAALTIIVVAGGLAWLNSPALDAERAPAEAARVAAEATSEEVPVSPEADKPNWIERAWVSVFGESADTTPEPTAYPDEGSLDTFATSESVLTPSEPETREINKGDYTITTSDGTVWSCGTLYNSAHTDHVLNVPEAWFPIDIFKRLDFDGVLEGPYMIDFHVRQEQVDSLDAPVMRRAASGAGACIQESMTIAN